MVKTTVIVYREQDKFVVHSLLLKNRTKSPFYRGAFQFEYYGWGKELVPNFWVTEAEGEYG